MPAQIQRLSEADRETLLTTRAGLEEIDSALRDLSGEELRESNRFDDRTSSP